MEVLDSLCLGAIFVCFGDHRNPSRHRIEEHDMLNWLKANRKVMNKGEMRPVWKPMHKQPVYASVPAYVNGVSEAIFKIGMCLPAGPYVSDEDVKYIVETIKAAIE